MFQEATEPILGGVSPQIPLQAGHVEFQGHRPAHLRDQRSAGLVKCGFDRPAIERQLAVLPTQDFDPLAQAVAALADERPDDLEEAG